MAGRNFCSSCGARLGGGSVFCGNCGARVPSSVPVPAQQVSSLPISAQQGVSGVNISGDGEKAESNPTREERPEHSVPVYASTFVEAEAKPAQSRVKSSDMLVCSACGKDIDYKICKYCGGDAIEKGAQSPASVSFKRHFSNHTVLRQSSTGRLKVVKNGFNWYLLLYPNVFAFFYRLVPWGLIWWAIFFAWAAIDGFPFSLCCILQAVLAVFLAIKGNEAYITALRNSGWIVVDPAGLSEEEVSLLKTGDKVKKLLMAFVAYKAVEGMAREPLKNSPREC